MAELEETFTIRFETKKKSSQRFLKTWSIIFFFFFSCFDDSSPFDTLNLNV
jgi:hypothetical protein